MTETRISRAKFIANRFPEYLGSTLLNVGGGGKKALQSFLPTTTHYTELDVAGTPDIRMDLEQDCPLPFDTNSFETVVCTEVLEHLSNLHEVFAELVRVSSSWVIISLPNCLCGIDAYWKFKGSYPSRKAGITRGSFLKFYGLPAIVPEDRHKWFFSYSEAEAFINYHSNKKTYSIAQQFPTGLTTTSRKENLKRYLHRFFLSERVFIDRYSSTFWCVLKVKA